MRRPALPRPRHAPRRRVPCERLPSGFARPSLPRLLASLLSNLGLVSGPANVIAAVHTHLSLIACCVLVLASLAIVMVPVRPRWLRPAMFVFLVACLIGALATWRFVPVQAALPVVPTPNGSSA